MTHCHRLLLLYNTITKEDDNTLLSFSSQTQRRQNTQKNNKKINQEKRGNLPSSSCSALSLLAPASTFCFKRFLMASFSSHAKENKRKP
jgi:hypothetical protein